MAQRHRNKENVAQRHKNMENVTQRHRNKEMWLRDTDIRRMGLRENIYEENVAQRHRNDVARLFLLSLRKSLYFFSNI